jgi:hypothetical protein
MNALYFVRLYSPSSNCMERHLWSFRSDAEAKAEVDEYAKETRQRVKEMFRVCETADAVSIEV